MRLVVQRVNLAKVTNSQTGKVVGEIRKGYLVLLGVKEGDQQEEAERLAEKLSKLRVMSDKADKMNLSLAEAGGEVLVVSQFTLYADTTKGNRPSFVKAANPKLAKELYQHFVAQLKERKLRVETGEFGAYMSISAELDGPVTIIM